ncbi:60S acidic ribosomal protein P3-2 [Linum grandiflorum]
MGVFTFVCKSSGDEWSGKQIAGGDLEASAPSTFDLQRKLVKTVLATDSSGAVRSSFSIISPSSAVFQVIVGGAVGGGGLVSSGGGGGGPPAAAAADAPAVEEKKEEEKDESDDDLGFSLFD